MSDPLDVAEHVGSHYCLNGRHNEAFGPCVPLLLTRQRDGARARADYLESAFTVFQVEMIDVLGGEGEMEPDEVVDLARALVTAHNFIGCLMAKRRHSTGSQAVTEVANDWAALLADPAADDEEVYETIAARLTKAEENGPGGHWTRAEWSEWSNDLANLLPEDAESMWSNPEGAQESIIEDSLRVLVEQREAVLAIHVCLDGEWCNHDGFSFPCATARALGVTE